MAGTQTATGSGHVEVALAIGLSSTFVILAVLLSPLVAAAVVVPASLAVGWWRAHTLPRRRPHSLTVPTYAPTAVVHAARVSPSSAGNGVTTAA